MVVVVTDLYKVLQQVVMLIYVYSEGYTYKTNELRFQL